MRSGLFCLHLAGGYIISIHVGLWIQNCSRDWIQPAAS
jgi:hypothetical protein